MIFKNKNKNKKRQTPWFKKVGRAKERKKGKKRKRKKKEKKENPRTKIFLICVLLFWKVNIYFPNLGFKKNENISNGLSTGAWLIETNLSARANVFVFLTFQVHNYIIRITCNNSCPESFFEFEESVFTKKNKNVSYNVEGRRQTSCGKLRKHDQL